MATVPSTYTLERSASYVTTSLCPLVKINVATEPSTAYVDSLPSASTCWWTVESLNVPLKAMSASMTWETVG